MDNIYKIKTIHTKFMIFCGNMSNIWEEYAFLVHCVNNASAEEFELESLNSNDKLTKTKSNAGGMKSRFINSGNARTHFIDVIISFENYITNLAKYVYLDFPSRIGGGMEQQKLFDLIIKSEDKQEMIDCLAEEKIRSIFYGNPADIFLKDKCKFEIGNIFKEDYRGTIELYKEITGRRNIMIHNLGRVDKKYLKENPSSKFAEGEKILITEQYLKGTIGLLIGIAAVTTKCVVEKIYKGNCIGRLDRALGTFDKCIDKDWYNNLLSN